MGIPRHSPCLGYLAATLFILSIFLQCVNSLNGVFKVQTKYVKKPFHPIKSRYQRTHERMLLGSSTVDIQLQGGNATMPLYIMEVAIGTPPQIHRMLVDTGSGEIWVNCAECENCVTDLNGVHLPPYDPSLSSTANIWNFTTHVPHCNYNVNGRCRFIYSYAERRGMQGYVVDDKFLIGNPLTGHDISADLRFGCITKHNYSQHSDGTDFFDWGIDGIIGLGDYGHSLIRQFNSTGLPSRELAHCLDNVNGGGVFAIGHVIEPQVPMTDRFDYDYDLLLLGLDFGGANVTITGTSVVLFDCGSDMFYVPDQTFQDINGKYEALLAQKNVVVKQRVGESTCFQLPGGRALTKEWVDQEFQNITLHFPGSMVYTVAPHIYLRPLVDVEEDVKGYWCLFVSPMEHKWGNISVLPIGSSFMSEKLIVFDNVNDKVGWIDHDCSVPIQVEGADGKPVPLGPHI